MTTHAYLDHGVSILKARLGSPRPGAPASTPPESRPFITVSREVCAGATTLSHLLLPRLDAEFGEPGGEWVLLDKDLLTYALARHELPLHLARYLPEDKISEIDAMIGEIVGLHPSLWELEQQVAQTIVQLAHVGHIVFVGRAAHLLTQTLPGGFHVRLVASKDTRVRRQMLLQHVGLAEAESLVERTDLGRRRFVRSHFGRDIDDPHTYDIVINTDRVSPETAATLVMEGLRQKIHGDGARAPGQNAGEWPAAMAAEHGALASHN
jgi:cytidylate kinase